MSGVFELPEGPALELELAPRLESWNRQDHPDQVALREFVSHVRERIDPLIAGITGPLAFRLDVGVPEQYDPLWERDLDNYLFPIARELPERVVSVWGTKGRGVRSAVRVERAVPAQERPESLPVPRSSSNDGAWKAVVNEALADADELPEGPIGLELAMKIGSVVNWPSLWKPSIDGLSRLLGRTDPNRDWNPLDGRIVRLGLHKMRDPTYGREAAMDVSARSADETWPELSWLSTMTAERRAAFFEQHRAKHRLRIERSVFRHEVSSPRAVNLDTAQPAALGSGKVVAFRDDDDGYQAWLASNPRGFVMNIQRALNPSDARVHRADCWTIAGEPARGQSRTGPYIKLCAVELHELDRWATDRLGARIEPCSTCRSSLA